MKRICWLILVLMAVSSACESGGTPLAYPLLDCDPLVPEFCGYPFPSNVYTTVDTGTPTGRRVAFGPQLLRGENQAGPWNASDGFSAGTPILAYLPGVSGQELGGEEDIEQSLSEASPTIVLDAATGELVPHFAEIDVRAPTTDERSTSIRPVVRLKDNARYIVALRSLTNEGGDVIEASPAFAALRDNTASEDESVEARRDVYEDIFAKLEAKGWARSEVQIAWDFTTASDENNTQWLLHMRDEAFQLIEDDGGFEYRIISAVDDYRPEHIAFRIEGEFRVPLYTDQPQSGALLLFGEDGLPEVNAEMPWVWVPFTLFIPQSATTDPAAIVEYGHGLFGEREEPTFGGGHQLSFMNEYNYAFASADLWGMEEPDRFTVLAKLVSGEVSQLQTMFDRLHQGFLNYVLLMRMMKTSFAADETYGQYLDADEAYYYGISQGGIMGPVFLALSDDVERGALGVMGQPYSLLLFRASGLAPFLEVINNSFMDKREHQLIVALYQMLWDRVEPNGYSHHVTENPLPGVRAKSVLTRSAVGDNQVTTLAAQLMARTMNASHLETGVRDVWPLEAVASTAAGESVYVEYGFGLPKVPLCDVPAGLCDDPHELPRRRESARKQLDEFLRTGVGTNYCLMEDDVDEHDAVADGVCSYPTLSGCTDETDEDSQALCMPSEAP
jgi:hypothetical protein